MSRENTNETKLLNFLLSKRTYASAKEIADILQKSPKTVYRIIRNINKQNPKQEMIESRRGLGYKLNYSAYISQHPEYQEHKQHLGELTSVERRSHILRQLLVTSPEKHKIHDVFGQFYLSESVISSDIRMIRKMIDKYGLKLRRQNDYLWITGKEDNIRTVINDLMINDDDISISHFLKSNESIRQTDASFITRQINLIEEELDSNIPYPYDINLFSHLYIMVERYHQVGTLVVNPSQSNQLLKKINQKNSKVIEVLKRVIANISQYLHTDVPATEIYSLYQYLSASRLENKDTVDEIGDQLFSNQDKQVTRFLIDEVPKNANMVGIDKKGLFEILIKHIKPMLNRLDNNIKIKNGLLNQVKLEYPTLFNAVQLATNQLSSHFNLRPINEDEVGFITVYFAQALEKIRKSINTIVVCTTGLGTAQLLKTKLGNRFPILNIVQTTSSADVGKVIQAKPDIQLIVSTLALPSFDHVHELVVSALFTGKDQERLEQVIAKIRNGH